MIEKIKQAVTYHKLVRRLLLIWAVGIITYATIRTYEQLEMITNQVVSLYGLTLGILSTVIGVYFHDRHKEDTQGDKNGKRN
jgi:hypothetical protein